MGEIVDVRLPRGPQKLRFERLIEGVEGRHLLEARGASRDLETEHAVEARGGAEKPVCLVGQARESSSHDLAHALGKAQLLDREVGLPASLRPVELARFHQMQNQLADEERIALCLSTDRLAQGLRHLVRGQGLQQLMDFASIQPPEQNTLVLRLALQCCQRIGQGMLAVEFDVPVGPDQKHGMARGEARQMTQHGDRAAIPPVEIVEYESQRRALGGGHQELGDRVQQAMALLVGLQRGRLGQTRNSLAQLRDQLCDRSAVEAEVLLELPRVTLFCVVTDGLHEGAEGRLPVPFVAGAPEHHRPLLSCVRRELLERARLADPRLAHQHGEPALSRLGPLQELLEACDLVAASHKRSPAQDRRGALGFVHDLRDADGIGDALELAGAEIPEAKCLAAAEETRHGGAAQNLARLRAVAQAPGDHHRGAEIVTPRFLLQDLARVQTHADLKALLTGLELRRLLDRDRAAHGVGRGGEGRHQTVAQPLELLAPRGLHRFL